MKHFFRFSLVELMAVVVIGSILLAIAVPSFSRMMRGSASTQAGRELMGRIQAARSHAVAQQNPVAVVFYSNEIPTGQTLSQDYAFSAYRTCTVKYDTATKVWVFQDWVSEWYFLPRGIAIGLPETMTATLPASMFADRTGSNAENSNALIRVVDSSAEPDSTDPDHFKVQNSSYRYGNSPVYFCDISDLYDGATNPFVTFRNAIVFNSNGMMEKPRNVAMNDTTSVLTPDVPVVIPLREALIDGNTVSFSSGAKDYIPIRVEPSGKTCFYDGYCTFP